MGPARAEPRVTVAGGAAAPAGLRRALLALGAAGAVAGAVPLALALGTEAGHHRGLISVFGPLVGWAFVGSGLFAWARRPQNRFGALMAAVGFAYCASGLIVATESWPFIAGLAFIPLPYAILYHVLLAFPAGAMATPGEGVLVATGYLSATVAQWTAMLFQDTAGQGLPDNPLVVVDDFSVARTIYDGRFALGLGLIGALALILARRWRVAPAPQRRPLAPVLLSGGLVMGLFAVWYAGNLVRLPVGWLDALEQARVVALGTVPFAFLAGLLSSRMATAEAVSELVARLGDPEDRRRGLREALADALGDPSLTVAYWLPERGEYVDAAGRRVELPRDGSERIATSIADDGSPVAAIIHDASLVDDVDLVRAVGAATRLTLENERLDAELRVKLEELRASRARIVESADAARRRIERDLHDGAQQQLVTLAIHLRLARSKLDEDPRLARSLLDSVAENLSAALAELRELARGIHPAALTEHGLRAALNGLTGRAPVPVELVETPDERLPQEMEATAYFVVAEAITNVAKYAQASEARVRVAREDDRVLVEVADDGVGGADPERGSGLRGLADRVTALDGRFEVDSRPGRGTLIRATIPYAHDARG